MNKKLLFLLCLLLSSNIWAQPGTVVPELILPLVIEQSQPSPTKTRSARLMAAATTIRYVKAGATGTGASWTNASGDLQAMINASAFGDQVWVAGGTYKPSTSGLTDARAATFRAKAGVTILGGFTGATGTEGNASARTTTPSSTTLSGDLGTIGDQADNAYHVVYVGLNAGEVALLDGLCVTAGNANGSTGSDKRGGGIFISGNGSLANCLVTGNTCIDLGGGIYVQSATGGSWENCQITNNSAPQGNGSGGGGMVLQCANYQLRNCQFTANQTSFLGGGLYVSGSNPIQLASCVFDQNAATAFGGFGGGLHITGSSNTTIINSFFTRNRGNYGGALITNSGSVATCINTTFRANTSGVAGGAVYSLNDGRINLTNCVLWDNSGPNVTAGFNNYFSYSLTPPVPYNYHDQGGNIIATFDPFESSTGPALKACAPAIDAGSDGANATTTDVLGNARKVRTIDMGAAEFKGTPTQPLTITQSQSATTVCAGDLVRFGVMPAGTGPFDAILYLDNAVKLRDLQSPEGLEIRATIVSTQSGTYQFVVTSACNSVTTTYAPLTVNPLPTQYAVTGGGTFCQGGAGIVVGLSGSQTGVNYQLRLNGNAVGSPLAGTGGALNFGAQITAGTYTVQAINATTACQQTLTGSATVSVNQSPMVSIVPSALTGCAGTIITLSAQGADRYVWNTGATTTSIPVSATGTGVYSVTGTITSTGCSATASQSITIYPLPAAPSVLTQTGQSYPGGQSSVSVDVNSGNVNLVVGGCNGTINWTGPAGSSGTSSPIVVSTDRVGTYVYTATCTSAQGCTRPPASATVIVRGRLTVLHRDVDNYADNNAIQPLLVLQNQGSSALPLSRLTLRYYLTVEGNSALTNLSVNYAQLGNQNVRLRYVPLQPAQQGASGYVEVSFTAGAGSLAAGTNSGPIQAYFAKSDYSSLFEPDDYSYNPVRDQLTATQRITAYYDGVLIAGVEPGSTATVRAVRALTESRNGPSATQINTVLEVRNEGTVPLNYSDLRARYYFTSDGAERLQVEVDEGNVSAQLVALNPAVAGANYYLEIRYNQGGQLAPGASTGAIRYRISKPDGGRFDQTNDYSYQEQPAERSQNSRVPVYVGQELVWGTPPSGAARLAASLPNEPGTTLTVTLLGNPIAGDMVDALVGGAAGQALTLQLTDLQGRVVARQGIEAASASERVKLSVSQAVSGILLLQVSTPTQHQTVKVLKGQ